MARKRNDRRGSRSRATAVTLSDLIQASKGVSTLYADTDYAMWASDKRSVEVRPLRKGWVVEQTIFDDREVWKTECETERDAVETFCALLPPTVKARLRMPGNEGSTPSGGSRLEDAK